MSVDPAASAAAAVARASLLRAAQGPGAERDARPAPATGSVRSALGAPAARSDDARLRDAAKALEGVFLNQLFKAMRETVPNDGLVEQSPAQEMFTAMLDERMAQEAARRLRGGLSEALYRQLQTRLEAREPKP